MPRHTPVQSLLDKCIEKLAADDTTAHDFDSIAALQHGQISLEILKKKLVPYNNLKKHQIDGLLSRRLSVIHRMNTETEETFYASDDVVIEILKTIGAKKLPLKRFSMQNRISIDINLLLPAFSQVQEIVFSSSIQINSESLKVLKKFNRLKFLSIMYMDELKAKELVNFFLTEMNSLKRLNVSGINVANAICRLRRMDPNFSSSITRVFVNLRHDNLENDIDFQLDEVISGMKEIKIISIGASNAEKYCDFNCLNTAKANLEDLGIQGPIEYGLNNTFRVIEYHGKTLTQVDFYRVNDLDLIHFLHHCPHLEKLSIFNCSLLNGNINMQLDSLRKLTRLHIFYYHFGGYNDIKENFWLVLLAKAKMLKSLDLRGFYGTYLQSALKKVYKRHNFPSLNDFRLINVNDITLTDLLPMIEHSKNPLKQVIIENCNDIAIDDLNKYKERMISKFGNVNIHNEDV